MSESCESSRSGSSGPALPVIDPSETADVAARLRGSPESFEFTVALLRAFHTEDRGGVDVIISIADALIDATCSLLGSLTNEVERAVAVLRIVERVVTKKSNRKRMQERGQCVAAFESAVRRLVPLVVHHSHEIGRVHGVDSVVAVLRAAQRMTGQSLVPPELAQRRRPSAVRRLVL